MTLVSRQPCLNGYTNTIDHIGSGINPGSSEDQQQQPGVTENRTGKPSLLISKMSKFNEKDVAMSPGLKTALNKSNFDRGKQGSVFKKNLMNEEKKAEEENKDEKK